VEHGDLGLADAVEILEAAIPGVCKRPPSRGGELGKVGHRWG
jgi:hypothetical protein